MITIAVTRDKKAAAALRECLPMGPGVSVRPPSQQFPDQGPLYIVRCWSTSMLSYDWRKVEAWIREQR